MELVPLKRDRREMSSLCPVRVIRKVAIYKSGAGLPLKQTLLAPKPWTSASRTMRLKLLLFKPPSLCSNSLS